MTEVLTNVLVSTTGNGQSAGITYGTNHVISCLDPTQEISAYDGASWHRVLFNNSVQLKCAAASVRLRRGRPGAVAVAAQISSTDDAIVSVVGNSAGLSNVVYDGSGRVTSYTLGGVNYAVTGWGSSTVTINGSDGSVRTISVDAQGRFTGVV